MRAVSLLFSAVSAWVIALFSASDVVSVSESSHSLTARGYVVFSVTPLDIPCAAQGLCLGGVALEGAASLFHRCAVAYCAVTVYRRCI